MPSLKIRPHANSPLLHGLLAFLSLVAAWSLLAELVMRSPLGYIVPPSVGADNFQFDLKTYYLEQFIRQRGGLDCVILGSSLANSGLDPAVIEQVYAEKTGKSIRCFNFGLSALTLESGGELTRALVRRYPPKLLIVVLSPRDFSTEYGDLTAPLLRKEWVRQNLGQPSLRGWLANNLAGYRYALAFQYWLRPENRAPFLEEYRTLTHQGFAPLVGFRDPPKTFPAFKNFRPDPQAWQGFQSIAALGGMQVIFVEAPINPQYLEYYLETPQGYEQRFIQPIQGELAGRGIAFLRTWDLAHTIPADSWYDSLHLNTKGVDVFSRWLGGQLSQLYKPDLIP